MKNLKLLLLTFILICSCSSDSKIEEIEEEEIEEKEIFAISFPDNFKRGTAKCHVVLSDINGKVIEVKTHANVKEDITFYTKESFDKDTPYTLTFIMVYSDVVYNLFVYSNVTPSMLEGGIQFKEGAFPVEGKVVDVATNNLNYDILSARGLGYSMVRIDNKLSGHYTSKFNNDLSSENVFIKYYDRADVINDSYKWMLIDNLSEVTLLDEINFNTDNVEYKQLTTNVPGELPLLLLYGYEKELYFNNMAGHEIYASYIPAFGFGGNHYFSYANIFEKMAYSLSFTNYSLFGVGLPPSEIVVPNKTVSASFYDNNVTFHGVEDYEVGRVRLDNYNLNLNIECIFDGASTEVILPEIPDGLLTEEITETINNGNLRMVQVVAEDYESFDNYHDYIYSVLRNSTPFYLSSSKRERILKSFISSSGILPISEFPAEQSFR
ncbi:hypothetical protein [Pseudotamlana agarivorans]|uniref:hypothetical protein n=1 Tax=Pseudotamlana agarivorans TaxID=481183 RepID=UPI00083594E4|nr:hypothetical protein [Tamlana agarivorans]